MTRLLTAVFAAALAGLITLTGGLAAFMTSLGGDCASPAAATRTDHSSRTPASTPSWDNEQVGNAVTIVTVGVRLGVPPRGQIIALATAIQESGLRNLTYGDQDSIGLFQQRPSQGWGTPAQILDPAYAATRFYHALLAEPDWQTLPLTVAAQGVQRSGHPDAYAAHETAATQLYAAITGAGASAFATVGACVPAADELTPPSLPTALALPPSLAPRVAVAISWALAQLGTPYAYGGDCTAAHSGNPAHQCDCSSLVQQAYAHAGITLPRTAADQSRVGAPMPVDRIQPGDLIFESGSDGTPTNPGHVALALGNGYLVEAPHTGAVVRIASTFPRDVVAVRRVVPGAPTAEPAQPLPASGRPR